MILANRFSTEIVLKWNPHTEEKTALNGSAILWAGYAYLVLAQFIHKYPGLLLVELVGVVDGAIDIAQIEAYADK